MTGRVGDCSSGAARKVNVVQLKRVAYLICSNPSRVAWMAFRTTAIDTNRAPDNVFAIQSAIIKD